ncbi:MAG TPA: Uma2 family endonuclease [Gemmataceae bacterium]|nr:Uma2 family endonuclease [Gemmataceae bacterium]
MSGADQVTWDPERIRKTTGRPDVVVVLTPGRAVDCNTHWMGDPDFLVEIQSPVDQTDEQIPFYSPIGVQELLISERDTHRLQLYRHDGRERAPVQVSEYQGGKWLLRAIVPLAFRRKALRSDPVTEVQRSDRTPGNWII